MFGDKFPVPLSDVSGEEWAVDDSYAASNKPAKWQRLIGSLW